MGAFVLRLDVEAPTLEEVAAVQAEVNDDKLTKAIEVVKVTVRTSSRLQADSKKVQANNEVKQLGIASNFRISSKCGKDGCWPNHMYYSCWCSY